MKSSRMPAVAFAVCGLIWGSTFLAIRIGNETFPALWSCALRLVLASVVLGLILVATRQPLPRGEALKSSFWYGFWEFGVSLPLLYWGEQFVPSGLAAVLYALCPITAMFGARALGMEKLSAARLAAAIIAFGGVAIIFWRQVLEGTSPAGFAAITLATVGGSAAGLALERGPQQNAFGVNAVGSVVGLVSSLVASFALGEAHAMPTLSQAFPIIYLTLMSSVVAFGLFAWLIGQWNTTTVSFLGVIVPVLAVGFGALFLGERLAPGALIGAFVVIVGVVIALRSGRSSAEPGKQSEGAFEGLDPIEGRA